MAREEVIDSKGVKLGKASQIYLDEQTAQPTWLSIKSGLFGSRSSFVPLDGANWEEGTLVVAYDKDTVQGAPDIDDTGTLSADEERTLRVLQLGLWRSRERGGRQSQR